MNTAYRRNFTPQLVLKHCYEYMRSKVIEHVFLSKQKVAKMRIDYK